jgi:hypothetical protein
MWAVVKTYSWNVYMWHTEYFDSKEEAELWCERINRTRGITARVKYFPIDNEQCEGK